MGRTGKVSSFLKLLEGHLLSIEEEGPTRPARFWYGGPSPLPINKEGTDSSGPPRLAWACATWVSSLTLLCLRGPPG